MTLLINNIINLMTICWPLDGTACLRSVSDADGYTVSDVVMYWKETPVRGVEGAELPQFSILGHETNDRTVRTNTRIR